MHCYQGVLNSNGFAWQGTNWSDACESTENNRWCEYEPSYEHHAHGYAHRRYLSCQNYWLDLMWMCDFQGKRTQIVCVFDAIWHLARLYYLCFITGSSVTDFEYTPEMSCFDLLDMDLRHGWLLDPQDRETVHLVQLYFVCRMWFKGPWFHVSHFGCLT